MSAIDVNQLQPGSLFGRYQLQAKLGEGAMGTVWKALHLGLKKPVALKLLKGELASDATIRGRFVREGEAASRIRHPNVVDVYDAGECEGVPYLAMELLDGESLADKYEREGALPPEEIAEVMLPVLAAVSAAHQEGVVHRDLKPENIFLTRNHDGTVHPKVLDFGISRVVNDRSGRVRTQVDVILGTPHYMSPEQARAEGTIDDRSDQYAIGAILYEAATGRIAFDDAPLYLLLKRVAEGEFRAPRVLRPEVPLGLEAVILRAMALDPRHRFRSLRSMGASLLPFANERTRALWAATFDPQAAGLHGATLVDEERGPAAWVAADATLVDDGRGGDTLPDRDAGSERGHAGAPQEAETVVLERRREAPKRRGVIVVAVGAALLIAVLVVAALAAR